MAKAVMTLLIVFLTIPVTASQLRVNVYDFPPHVFVENGKPRGPGITFYETYLNHTVDPKLHWNPTPFARVLQDLQHGRTDVALFLARTPDREKFLRFSTLPLHTTFSAIIIRRDSVLARAKSLQDFKGLTLGHSKDSFTPHELLKNGIKIEPLSGEDVIARNIQKVRGKRLDGIYIPTVTNGEYVLTKLGVEKEFAIFVVPNSKLNLHLAFRKDIDEKTFQRIDGALKKHHSAYKKLLQQQMQQSSRP